MKTKYFCHGILKNENNELLVLKRSNKDLYPQKWDLPGGFKEKNETFDECVIREFKEETGLNIIINNIDEIKVQDYNKELIVVLIYSVSCDDFSKIILDDAHTDYKIIKMEDLNSQKFENELIWYLEEFSDDVNKTNQENKINYLFSCINTINGYTIEQAKYLKKDIKSDSQILFIPADFKDYKKNNELAKQILNIFKKININFKKHLILDDKMNINKISDTINNFNVIFLMGGNPKKQMENIQKYKLKNILKKHNGIIIGTSAGAMNQSNNIIYLDENNNIIEYEGLGLVNLQIYPHLDINNLENLKEILKVSNYKKIYCLPNESFIRVENKNITIEGLYFVLG